MNENEEVDSLEIPDFIPDTCGCEDVPPEEWIFEF